MRATAPDKVLCGWAKAESPVICFGVWSLSSYQSLVSSVNKAENLWGAKVKMGEKVGCKIILWRVSNYDDERPNSTSLKGLDFRHAKRWWPVGKTGQWQPPCDSVLLTNTGANKKMHFVRLRGGPKESVHRRQFPGRFLTNGGYPCFTVGCFIVRNTQRQGKQQLKII